MLGAAKLGWADLEEETLGPSEPLLQGLLLTAPSNRPPRVLQAPSPRSGEVSPSAAGTSRGRAQLCPDGPGAQPTLFHRGARARPPLDQREERRARAPCL